MTRHAAAMLVALAMPLVSHATDSDWLYLPYLAGPDEPIPASTLAADQETAKPEPIPVGTRSSFAWQQQSEWLIERLSQRNLTLGSPVHIRIFKRSLEMELYIEGDEGFELYRVFPICRMSGSLGPKRFEGDLQAPEGFYDIRPERLHPHSDFHLAFNLGFPNDYDRSLERTGSNIMIHGGCASNGCFAMTDYYMEQLWLFAEAALRGGQQSIGVEIYPFRMTEANLSAHASSRWIDFWRSLKPLHDHFLDTGLPAPVSNLDGRYVLARPDADVEHASPAITAAEKREADGEPFPAIPSAP